MVACSENMRTEIEEFFSNRWGEAETARRVFCIDNDEVHLSLLNDMGQVLPHDTASGTPEYVPYKEQFHRESYLS